MNSPTEFDIKRLGLTAYEPVWRSMLEFTDSRTEQQADAIWLTEHQSVFTLGLAGKPEHLLHATAIPVVHTDRGGQITYHGPGQAVMYPLLDLRRYDLKVREYVHLMEEAIILSLAKMGINNATRKADAPGVYIPLKSSASECDESPTDVHRQAHIVSSEARPELAKIAALGIKVRNGCTYHGLALNVDMDLTPFSMINPCGYEGLKTIDLNALGVRLSVSEVCSVLIDQFVQLLRQSNAHGKGV
jgi:lipoyl(octanoyl) transferase